MDARLVARAMLAGGVFTLDDLRAIGIDRNELRPALASGDVVRVRRNAYVLGSVWSDADPGQRYALRVRAVMASRGGRDIATHRSALALHGLPVLDPHIAAVELAAPVQRVRRDRALTLLPLEVGAISPDRSGATPAEVEHGGLVVANLDGDKPAVSVATAIVQVALAHGVRDGVVALDAAWHRGMCRRQDVEMLARHLTSPLGLGAVGRVLDRADPQSESVGETLTRLLLDDLGVRYVSQHEVRDDTGAFVARVDFLIEGEVVVEFDGLLKYEGVDGRSALAAEKEREDRLRALGYRVVRLTWADLDQPTRVAGLLRAWPAVA